MPKISVVVPVYKVERLLGRCVDSLRCQTFRDLEIILVDDGSPDNCPGMCDQYADGDSRVKVIHKSNGGVSSARNAGLEAATGEYITFVDSDDYVDKDMYSSMVAIIDRYDCDVVVCDCKKEYADHSEVYSHNIRSGYYDKEQLEREYYPHLVIMENVEYPPTISNCLCLFRKKNTPIRYLEGVRFSEDWLFGIQMMVSAESFYYMKGQCFYHYCMNQGSATHTFRADKWRDYLILYHETVAFFSKNSLESFFPQTDLMLLFLVYNAVGDILNTNQIDKTDKRMYIDNILKTPDVQEIFARIRVHKLQIPLKLKIQTYMYKFNFGISYLCKRKE